nr:YebC/PmpR family DNA-binding transcriptional regulator [Gammaproteobacteria bacterium]
MAGHSKWANIQHRKGAQDAKRGKLFTRLIREVTVAARLGGADPKSNFRLRGAIEKALAGNVPKDNVERAIKRAAGDQDAQNIDEVRYEGYGPGGTAIMVDCMTDNRNRTVAEVRHVFSRCGGNLGLDGSVGYLFQEAGQLSFPVGTDEDRVMEAALEAGADDVITHPDGAVDVITSPERFADVKDAMISAGFEPVFAEVTLLAATSVQLELEDARRVIKLIEMLEDVEDVQQVYSNADISDDILAQLD